MNEHRVTLSKQTFKTDCLNFFAFTQGKDEINAEKIENGTELFYLYNNYKKTSIYTSHKHAVILKDDFRNKPKLITIAKKIDRHHYPSDLGKFILNHIGYISNSNKTPQNFIQEHNGRYVAVLSKIFELGENRINIWNEFCTNGLFNVWNPAAPYNRLNYHESDGPNYYQVKPFSYNLHTGKYNTDGEVYMHIHQLPDAKILLLRIFRLGEEDCFEQNNIKILSKQYDEIRDSTIGKKVSLNNPVINDFDFNCIYSEIKDAFKRINVKPVESPNIDRNSNGEKTTSGFYNTVTGRTIEYIPFNDRITKK